MRLGIGIGASHGPRWSPLAYAPDLLLDAADCAAAGDGGAIAAWAARTGQSFAQATASKKPTYSATGGAGSQSGVSFDGVDDSLRCDSAAAALFNGVAAATLYAVLKSDPQASARYWLYGGTKSGNTNFTGHQSATADVWIVFDGAHIQTRSVSNAAGSRLCRVLFTGSGTFSYRVLGSTTSSSTTVTDIDDCDALALGVYVAGGGSSELFPWAGVVSWLGYWKRVLAAAEQARVESYLAARFGVTA